ncbi:MAG: DUF4340 domain-containing protein [Pseudomonadota bacterium]
MRVKTEYLVLTAIIIAAAAYLVLHKQNREHYTLPKLPSVAVDKITRVEIARSAQTITLTKDGDIWKITPGGYTADGAKVKGMLSAIADLSLTALVSESKAYARYDLSEDKRIRVTAYGGDRQLDSVDIGKAAATFQHTFVKLSGDDRVYHGAGDFRRQFDRSVEDLRDKVIMTFKPEKVEAITAETLTEAFGLERKTDPAETAAAPAAAGSAPVAAWVTADGRAIAGSVIDPFLNRLNRMECSRYLDNTTPEALGTPTLTVTLGGEKALSLQIYPEISGITDGKPAVSSENPQPFILSSWQVESLEEMIGAWKAGEKAAAAPMPGNNPPKAQ